ncbi:unnamed protein product [Darwinula stevensoni]|uniref:BTB domain-containing protein n=1 Tax=Darwinula stevensoni TaxID=69355 RepID=A0A7R9A6K9_9CRUS|nr:unnamed protein product [Darwinula stevensoni]CAG0889528.1 unnamed protein product [Darwinula stevensoni]
MESEVSKQGQGWKSRCANAFNVFHQFRNIGTFVDITLVCDGQALKAHKLVLCATSGYFEDMLQNETNPNPIIYMCGVPLHLMKQLLNLMYTGKAEIDPRHEKKFLELLQAMEVEGFDMKEPKYLAPQTCDSIAPVSHIHQAVAHKRKVSHQASKSCPQEISEENTRKKSMSVAPKKQTAFKQDGPSDQVFVEETKENLPEKHKVTARKRKTSTRPDDLEVDKKKTRKKPAQKQVSRKVKHWRKKASHDLTEKQTASIPSQNGMEEPALDVVQDIVKFLIDLSQELEPYGDPNLNLVEAGLDLGQEEALKPVMDPVQETLEPDGAPTQRQEQSEAAVDPSYSALEPLVDSSQDELEPITFFVDPRPEVVESTVDSGHSSMEEEAFESLMHTQDPPSSLQQEGVGEPRTGPSHEGVPRSIPLNVDPEARSASLLHNCPGGTPGLESSNTTVLVTVWRGILTPVQLRTPFKAGIMCQFINVFDDTHGDALLVELDENGTLPFTTLRSQFHLAIGLQYDDPVIKRWKCMQHCEEYILPPPGGWGERVYFRTYQDTVAVSSVVVSSPLPAATTTSTSKLLRPLNGTRLKSNPLRLVPVTLQQKLQLQHQATGNDALNDLDGLPPLPLKTQADIDQFEIYVQNNEDKSQRLIHLLSQVGGGTVAEATRNIMRKLLTTNMALEYNWTGKFHMIKMVKVEEETREDVLEWYTFEFARYSWHT